MNDYLLLGIVALLVVQSMILMRTSKRLVMLAEALMTSVKVNSSGLSDSAETKTDSVAPPASNEIARRAGQGRSAGDSAGTRGRTGEARQ